MRLASQTWVCATVLVVVLWLAGPQPSQAQAQAQEEKPVSHNENFSAKPAPQLFASDCTGGGCHNSPQGLAKGQSQRSLAGFLREHYTNSRESAAAIAAYLIRQPSGPPPGEARAKRSHPSARSSRASARSEETPARTAPGARSKSGARAQRVRQSVAPPPMPPEPPTPEPPAPKKFDIFD
jgi:hypothetical protein